MKIWKSGVLLVLGVVWCTEVAREELALGVNEFGYRLLVSLLQKAGDRNVVLGPTSVAGVLGMALLGSVGDTHDELAGALGFSRDILTNRQHHEQLGSLLRALDGGGTLFADAVFVSARAPLRPLYREFLQRVYRGAALPAAFDDPPRALTLINEWVKDKTLGKVKEFLRAPLPSDTRVALLSAHHFSGQWERPFTPEFTRNMTFHKSVGEVEAEMMLNYGHFDYILSEEHGCHMVSLPYNDSRTRMYVMKPLAPEQLSLSELVRRVDWPTLDRLSQRMRSESAVIRFPRMSLRSNVDLEAGLKALGIRAMFEGGKANFGLMVEGGSSEELISRLSGGEARGGGEARRLREQLDALPNPGVHVDTVRHEVVIQVDEWGTAAAAASGGFLSRTARTFLADSPFLFYIRDELSGLVTFSAVIQDPTLA